MAGWDRFRNHMGGMAGDGEGDPPGAGPLRKTRDGVPIDVRLGDWPPRPSARPEPHDVPNAAALAKLVRSGVIVHYNPSNALGWIELDGDRERIRFGVGALDHPLPEIGTAVRVLSVGVGYRGMPKATRVVRAHYIERNVSDIKARFRITDLRDHTVRDFELNLESQDMLGWNDLVAGWSIGAVGSGAPIVIDEPLDGCHVGIFPASNHIILWGSATRLPEMWVLAGWHERHDELVPFLAECWTRRDPDARSEDGRVYVRFDGRPLRLGQHIIHMRLIFPRDPALSANVA